MEIKIKIHIDIQIYKGYTTMFIRSEGTSNFGTKNFLMKVEALLKKLKLQVLYYRHGIYKEVFTSKWEQRAAFNFTP